MGCRTSKRRWAVLDKAVKELVYAEFTSARQPTGRDGRDFAPVDTYYHQWSSGWQAGRAGAWQRVGNSLLRRIDIEGVGAVTLVTHHAGQRQTFLVQRASLGAVALFTDQRPRPAERLGSHSGGDASTPGQPGFQPLTPLTQIAPH